VSEWTWDVFLPSDDLPHSLTTDYLLREGEAFAVDGREWVAERVEIEDELAATGIVLAALPRGPLSPTDNPT
jgi:hypothetical protein